MVSTSKFPSPTRRGAANAVLDESGDKLRVNPMRFGTSSNEKIPSFINLKSNGKSNPETVKQTKTQHKKKDSEVIIPISKTLIESGTKPKPRPSERRQSINTSGRKNHNDLNTYMQYKLSLAQGKPDLNTTVNSNNTLVLAELSRIEPPKMKDTSLRIADTGSKST